MTQESTQILSEQLTRVRKLAHRDLAGYSKLEPSDCTEVYLFNKDQFCGVRFLLGSFSAQWRTNENHLDLTRNDQPIAQIDINVDSSQRAA